MLLIRRRLINREKYLRVNELFRIEAYEHKAARRFGEALIISPLSFKILSLFVTDLIVAIGSFLYWGRFDNKQTVPEYILPSMGIVTIHAPQRGTVVVRYVDFGTHVRKGQKLYQFELLRSTLKTENIDLHYS